MPVQPETHEDTVLYGSRTYYGDDDLTVRMLDGSSLNIWGEAYLNGSPIYRSPSVVLTSTATASDITAASLALSATGGGVIDLVPGVYHIGSPGFTLHDGVHLRGNAGTILEFGDTGLNYPCLIAGTQSASTLLAVDATAASYTVTLPPGAGATFAIDDVIGFISDTIVSGTLGKSREIHQVISVAGDVITLDSPLYFSYLVSAAGSFFKQTPKKDITLSGFTMKWLPPDHRRGPILQKCIRCRMYDITSINGPGITFDDAINCQARNITIDGSKEYASAESYGITVSSSGFGTVISDCTFRSTRHAVTTIYAQDVSLNPWSGPFHTTIVNCVGWGGPESYAIFDTHEHAFDTMYIGCQAIGPGQASTAGFQDRANRTTISKCTVRGAVRGIVLVSAASTYATVEGCVVKDNTGISIAVSGNNAVVRGNRLISTGPAPILYGIQMGTVNTNCMVIDNVIEGIFGNGMLQDAAAVDNGHIAARNILKLQATTLGIVNWKGQLIDNVIHGDGTNGLPNYTFSTTGRYSRLIGPPRVITYAATYTPKPTWYSCFQFTLTGAITINNPDNNQLMNGLTFRLIFLQDATGGRVVSFGTAFKKNWTPVTTPNTYNIIDFQYDNVALAWVQIASEVGVV